MSKPTVIATMCEGALYCPEHSEYDAEDLAAAHVILITDFDVMCDNYKAAWVDGACCSGCGETF